MARWRRLSQGRVLVERELELSADDLRPERLRDRIEQAMAAPYPALQVATDGARVTSEHIRAVLERR